MAIQGTIPGSAWNNTLERKIHFFRVDVGIDAGGAPVPLDIKPICDHLSGLAYEEGQRYVDVGEGNVACAWVDRNTSPYRLRLATIRRTSLPMVEDGGTLTALDLTTAQGLYEPVHICMFLNNIVGIEFNFYGPRPSRLPSYLANAATEVCPANIQLHPLLRQDVTEQLDRINRLRLFDLAVRPSWVGTIRQANRSLGDAFNAAATVGGSQIVHIILQPEPYQRDAWLDNRLIRVARRLAGATGLRENAKTFAIKGLNNDGVIEEVDVLRDLLISTKRIVRLDRRSRALDDAAAYSAIEEAYSELQPQLEAASAAQLL